MNEIKHVHLEKIEKGQRLLNGQKITALPSYNCIVRTDNERATQLYKKLGFVLEGTITHAIKLGDIYFDEHVMGLLLT